MEGGTIYWTTSFPSLKHSNGFPIALRIPPILLITYKALKGHLRTFKCHLLPLFPSVMLKQLPTSSVYSLNMLNSCLPQGLCTCSCFPGIPLHPHGLYKNGSFLSFRPQVKCLFLREPFPTITMHDTPCPHNL